MRFPSPGVFSRQIDPVSEPQTPLPASPGVQLQPTAKVSHFRVYFIKLNPAGVSWKLKHYVCNLVANDKIEFINIPPFEVFTHNLLISGQVNVESVQNSGSLPQNNHIYQVR